MTIVRNIQLDELDALHIESEKFTAKIVLQGGHLIEFYTVDKSVNWLWIGDKVTYKKGVAIRGGVPICFPMFGNYAENPAEVQATFNKGMAKHGLARTSIWELLEQNLTNDKATVTLGWQVPEAFIEQYPAIKLEAKLIFELSVYGFSITLESQNLGEQEICLTQAFHTYLPTDDIRQTRIEGFNQAQYVDMLSGNTQTVEQVGDIMFDQEVDRIYDASPTITLKTPSYQATLTAKNSLSTVIWNPWVEKSKTLDQFAPNDFEKMLCIETANAGKDFVRLNAGKIKSLVIILSIQSY